MIRFLMFFSLLFGGYSIVLLSAHAPSIGHRLIAQMVVPNHADDLLLHVVILDRNGHVMEHRDSLDTQVSKALSTCNGNNQSDFCRSRSSELKPTIFVDLHELSSEGNGIFFCVTTQKGFQENGHSSLLILRSHRQKQGVLEKRKIGELKSNTLLIAASCSRNPQKHTWLFTRLDNSYDLNDAASSLVQRQYLKQWLPELLGKKGKKQTNSITILRRDHHLSINHPRLFRFLLCWEQSPKPFGVNASFGLYAAEFDDVIGLIDGSDDRLAIPNIDGTSKTIIRHRGANDGDPSACQTIDINLKQMNWEAPKIRHLIFAVELEESEQTDALYSLFIRVERKRTKEIIAIYRLPPIKRGSSIIWADLYYGTDRRWKLGVLDHRIFASMRPKEKYHNLPADLEDMVAKVVDDRKLKTYPAANYRWQKKVIEEAEFADLTDD